MNSFVPQYTVYCEKYRVIVTRRYKMQEFIDWAFYGKIVEGLKPEEVYTCYKIWCELFGYDPMKKFEFIEEWGKRV